MKKLYTIGHSTYQIDYFISILNRNKINTIVDVRSVPYSSFASQYNRDGLKFYLKERGINYIFMGNLLGAKHSDKTLLFSDGKVDFSKVQKNIKFQYGIIRLERGISKGYNISLMCSEKEPFDCHRFVLISKILTQQGVDINHIYPDKIVSQKELEIQLLNKYSKKIPKVNLFSPNITDKEQLELAYKFRNKDIAYRS